MIGDDIDIIRVKGGKRPAQGPPTLEMPLTRAGLARLLRHFPDMVPGEPFPVLLLVTVPEDA